MHGKAGISPSPGSLSIVKIGKYLKQNVKYTIQIPGHCSGIEHSTPNT
jgi:hypothetical protein